MNQRLTFLGGRIVWLAACAVLGSLVAGVAVAQETGADLDPVDGGSAMSQEQEAEQLAVFLFELQEQRRKLLEMLSPEVREKVLRRLQVLGDQRGLLRAEAVSDRESVPSVLEVVDSSEGTELVETIDSLKAERSPRVDEPPTALGPTEPDAVAVPTQLPKAVVAGAQPSAMELPDRVTPAEKEPTEKERTEKEPTDLEEAEPQINTIVDVAESAPAENRLAGRRRARCEAWTVFDTNGDDGLSGADRYWRHFSIWMDDGDGVPEEGEMKDSFALGLRKLSLDLKSYKGVKKTTGVVERRLSSGRERLRVEILKRVRGSGGASYGLLAIDIAGLVRGGGPRIRRFDAKHPKGEILTSGFVPVEQGVEIEVIDRSEEGGSLIGESGDGKLRETRWLPLLCARKGR